MKNKLKFEEIREKICPDFYPNCSYCPCFSECFPKDEYHDVMSKAKISKVAPNLS